VDGHHPPEGMLIRADVTLTCVESPGYPPCSLSPAARSSTARRARPQGHPVLVQDALDQWRPKRQRTDGAAARRVRALRRDPAAKARSCQNWDASDCASSAQPCALAPLLTPCPRSRRRARLPRPRAGSGGGPACPLSAGRRPASLRCRTPTRARRSGAARRRPPRPIPPARLCASQPLRQLLGEERDRLHVEERFRHRLTGSEWRVKSAARKAIPLPVQLALGPALR
jgi:hypothetical protein